MAKNSHFPHDEHQHGMTFKQQTRNWLLRIFHVFTMMQAFLVFICLASATLAFAPQPLTVKSGIPALPQTPASTRSPITFLRDASVSDQETDDTTLQAQSAVNVTTASNDTQVAVAPVDGQKEPEVWVDESKNVELIGLLVWGISLSAFILYNNFVEPWPMPTMVEVPIRFWRIIHVVSGMMFGGGIILTTLIEWLVASNKNPPVLQFWFDKVPLLDAAVVLPSLSISVISGTGLAIENYGGLGEAPVHIAITFYALVAFGKYYRYAFTVNVFVTLHLIY